MFDQILTDFLILTTTIDPIGSLCFFVALTASVPAEKKPGIALKAVFIGGLILFAALLVGQLMLTYLQIKLVSFQLAGGIILFLIGLQMVFGTGDLLVPPPRERGHDIAVFPLAIPTIAGPGSILAVIMLTDRTLHTLAEQLLTAGILLVVLLITYLLLLLARPVHKVIGDTGSTVVTKLMGILLAAMAADQCLRAYLEVARMIPQVD